MKNEYTGYATRSTMDLLNHLYQHYAHISLTDTVANDERLQASYNSEDPLEILIKRLNECVDFATAASKPVLET